MKKYTEIYEMNSLIKSLITKRGSVVNAIPSLWRYGIEYLGDNKFVCINKESKFFNCRCVLKPFESP